MTQSAAARPPIDPNNPFTHDLLRSLAGTIRAQPGETDAEYEERFAAATAAWASFRPRDPMQQMIAAQIVGAHYAALDCLNRATEAEDSALADKLWRTHATLTRTLQNAVRLLEHQQKRAADTAPLPVIDTIPPPRRRPTEAKPTQHPLHREDAPDKPTKDPAQMTDEELLEALTEKRIFAVTALFDRYHPQHNEVLRLLPGILPGVVVPDSCYKDTHAVAA